MTRVEFAIALAAQGFHVFPLQPNSKLPVIKDFVHRATRDPEVIRRWWQDENRNIGISTSRFGDDQALVVVDVDTKGAKDGEAQVLALELEGYELPASLEQATPSGGRHIVYVSPAPLKQGVNVLGAGVDIRSQGGYIVGPGSTIDGKAYRQINGHAGPVMAPDWLVERLRAGRDTGPARHSTGSVADPGRARTRALKYLHGAPGAVQGDGGDLRTYRVAAMLKDLGCDAALTLELMAEHWNERCEPPWDLDELAQKVDHAFRYGREAQGALAPESVFEPAASAEEEDKPHPVDALNAEYAFVKAGAFVLQETTDAKGRFCTIRLTPAEMHAWFANKCIAVGDKAMPLSKLWMTRPARREYDNVVFLPESNVPPRFYNLWRGFSVAPANDNNHAAVKMFLEHALQNVCGGDETLCRWLLGYFAHMIQKPAEKPLVALVFHGEKGTGKNALVERVGALLGRHFLVADDQRYLLGNFNSHLEANLFFVLDEASWAGDKRAEGKLKGLITGSEHIIERKGSEPYTVDNLTRVAIIGNDRWLVPASVEERRFAVFEVGNGRRQDRKFFEEMRVGMEQGGYACLLRYLMDYDLTGIDVNAAPSTQALIDQKHASLEPLAEWWLDCLMSNQLAGSEWDNVLPDLIPTNRAREAFEQWARSRNIRSRLPGRNTFLSELENLMGSGPPVRAEPNDPGDTKRSFANPGIEMLRWRWQEYIGGEHRWPE